MDPADGSVLPCARPTAPQPAFEGMNRNLEMGVRMPVDSQRLAHVHFHAKFFAQLPAQARSGRLAGAALPPGELPQSAQQTTLGASADQDAPAAANDAGCRDSERSRFASRPDRSEMLDAAQTRPAPASDGTNLAARVARQAHLRPQIHEGLVEV